MCKALEDMRNEVAQETERKTKERSVLRWFSQGASVSQIAAGEGLSEKEVNLILSSNRS